MKTQGTLLVFASYLLLAGAVPTFAAERPPQYICVAFDGSYSLDMWDETLNLAAQLSSPAKPAHFTYFVNAVYLLNKQYRKVYHPPVGEIGTAPLEFPTDFQDIENRVLKINRAIEDGHDIGSHTAGHRFGSHWTEAQWQQEFDEFNKLLFHYVENNHLNPLTAPALNLKPADITGFRAPGLSYNDEMFSVLRKNNFLYDASRPIRSNLWPHKEGNLWLFGLPSLAVEGTHPIRWTFAMDYNFYQNDTNLQPLATFVSGPEGAQVMMKRYGTADPEKLLPILEEQCYKTLMTYFLSNYYGNRATVQIGFHFTLFQDGIYWKALRRVIEEMATYPEVQFVNYKELIKILDSTPPQTLQAWQTGDFSRFAKPHLADRPASSQGH